MHALKTPFLRTGNNSRPSSPAPASTPPSRPDSGIVVLDHAPRSLHRLSLTPFRRSSSIPPVAPAPIPLVQDGSYLEMLGLKFSEAVSKAMAQPTGSPPTPAELLGGRRPIPAGRGHALGALIACEIQASRDNHHLHRAIIRCLQRTLSVLLTNISTHLLPLLASPAFNAPPTSSPYPNPTQLHALGLATFAGELVDELDELGLWSDADARSEGLRSVREGLVSMVNRVVLPLVTAVRNELFPLIDALETPQVAPPTNNKSHVGSKSTAVVQHPSIVALQGLMPSCARAMARYTTTLTSQATLTTFLISVIWRALVALAHRPPPPTEQRHQRTPPATPPIAPSPSRFAIKLPPSRPPSPPETQVHSTAAADATALCDLLALFPRPAAAKEATRLAREAVDDAFDGLKAFSVLLAAVQTPNQPSEKQLQTLTADVPTLIALPALLHALLPSPVLTVNGAGATARPSSTPASVAAILGMDEVQYRKGCLAGFARAEECVELVGQHVLAVLPPDTVIANWLEAEFAGDAAD